MSILNNYAFDLITRWRLTKDKTVLYEMMIEILNKLEDRAGQENTSMNLLKSKPTMCYHKMYSLSKAGENPIFSKDWEGSDRQFFYKVNHGLNLYYVNKAIASKKLSPKPDAHKSYTQ